MPVAIFPLFYWTEDRRRVIRHSGLAEVALVFSESYDTFIVLLAERRIFI